jgi:hypothetical protein
MSYTRTNEVAFKGYRHVVTNCIHEYRTRPFPVPTLVGYIGWQNGVPLSFEAGAIPELCAVALATWLFRYMRRRDASLGGGGYGEPVADTVAREILVSRNSARDSETPALPQWDPAVRRCAQKWINTAFNLRRIDVVGLQDIHGYGPSLRRLWAEAIGSGIEPWEYIRNWAFGTPTTFEEVSCKQDERLSAYLQQMVAWRSTGDVGVPWEAEGQGQRYQVRLNEYPDEWMYSLLVDGAVVGDFHDWPTAWSRGAAKRAARARAAKAPRNGGRVPSVVEPAQLLTRYRNGEHEDVWRDLESLGESVRSARYLEPARAVARETMRRARHNIEMIVARLRELNYRFTGIGEQCDRDRRFGIGMDEVARNLGPTRPANLQEGAAWFLLHSVGKLHTIQAQLTQPDEPHQPFVAPAAGVAKQLKKLARMGIVLPLSLEAWVEEVGSVDLTGAHPVLCFVVAEEGFPNVFADPLIVDVPLSYIAEEYAGEEIDCPISPDDDGKAGAHECEFYSVRLPNLRADTTLQGERHNTTFVNYLRVAFRWGGFPGWEQYQKRPEKELAVLSDSLLSL